MAAPEIIPVEAIQAGTVNEPNRSRQYQAAIHKTPEKLLEGVNVAGAIARGARTDLDKLQRQMMNLKLRNSVVVAIVTALLVKLPEIWAWLGGMAR